MGSPPAMHGMLSPGMQVPARPQLGRNGSPLAPSMPGAPQLASLASVGRAQSMGSMGPQYVVVGQALLSPGPCVHLSVPFPGMGATPGNAECAFESNRRPQRLPEKLQKHREAAFPTMSPEK